MIDREIKARFEEFSLPAIKPTDTSVVIPTVSGTRFSRYGTHAYYFLNFKTQKATCVKIRHRDIIFPGLKKLAKANCKQHQFLSRRSEEHTSELQSQFHLVCRLLLEKKQ